jgi:hypothetical protein
MNAELWDANEVAEYLGIDPNSWRSYVSRGTAPTPLKGFRPNRWHRQTIIDWDASRTTPLNVRASALRAYRRATARQVALLDEAAEAGRERGEHLYRLHLDGLSLRDLEPLIGISFQAIHELIRRHQKR